MDPKEGLQEPRGRTRINPSHYLSQWPSCRICGAFCLFVGFFGPYNLVSTGLEILIPRRALLPRKHLNVSLNWKLNHLELLSLVDKQEKNYCTDWFNWPCLLREARVVVTKWGKYEYIWIIGLTEASLGDSVPNDSCKWTLRATIAWSKENNQGFNLSGK